MIPTPHVIEPQPSPTFDVSDLPVKSPRSKLEPHRALIRELRRKGRTYREIAALFTDRLSLPVAPSTIHSFVKVRASHRKKVQFELPPDTHEPGSQNPVAALKARAQAETPKRPVFVYRSNEPLTISEKGGAK